MVGLGVTRPDRPRPLESRATSGDSEPRPTSALITSGGPPGPPGPSSAWERAGDLGCPLTSGHRKSHHSFEPYKSPYSYFTDKDTGTYKEKKGRRCTINRCPHFADGKTKAQVGSDSCKGHKVHPGCWVQCPRLSVSSLKIGRQTQPKLFFFFDLTFCRPQWVETSERTNWRVSNIDGQNGGRSLQKRLFTDWR